MVRVPRGGDRTKGTGPMGEGNLISWNTGGTFISGVYIAGLGTMHNTIIGNYIGTDLNGKQVLAIAPGYTTEDILKNMGFEPLVAETVEELEPPTAEELRLLREGIYLERVIIGRV